jgi:hypothetical protein
MPPREARGVVPRPPPTATTRPGPTPTPEPHPSSPAASHPRHPGERSRHTPLRPVLLGPQHSGPTKDTLHSPTLTPLGSPLGRSLSRSTVSTSRGWERPSRATLSASHVRGADPTSALLLVNVTRFASARTAARLSSLPRRYLPPAALAFDLAFEFSSLLLFVPWVLLFAFGSVLVPHLVIPDVGRARCGTATRRKDRPTSTAGAETQGTSHPPARHRARHPVPDRRSAPPGGGGS